VSRGHLEGCADAGDVEVQVMLGLLYSTGWRVEYDLVQGHQWLNLAALADAVRARALRGQVARDMSPAEIAPALKLARQWLTEQELDDQKRAEAA